MEAKEIEIMNYHFPDYLARVYITTAWNNQAVIMSCGFLHQAQYLITLPILGYYILRQYDAMDLAQMKQFKVKAVFENRQIFETDCEKLIYNHAILSDLQIMKTTYSYDPITLIKLENFDFTGVFPEFETNIRKDEKVFGLSYKPNQEDMPQALEGTMVEMRKNGNFIHNSYSEPDQGGAILVNQERKIVGQTTFCNKKNFRGLALSSKNILAYLKTKGAL